MNKKLFILPLLLLFLVSCSKTKIPASMYQLENYESSETIEDYKYEIINTYNDYQNNQNKSYLKNYDETYFNKSSLIIIFLKEPAPNKYELKEVNNVNNSLVINIECVFEGFKTV